MRSLRFTWLRRWIAALLVASLLPLVMGPLGDVISEGSDVRALWLRAQVDGAVPEVVHATFEAALDDAEAAAGSSLEAFTAAFAESYAERSPTVSLSTLFAISPLDGNELYRALHQRAQQLGSPAAVFPRLVGQLAASGTTTARMLAVGGTSSAGWGLEASWGRVELQNVGRRPASLIHLLFAAQPLGP